MNNDGQFFILFVTGLAISGFIGCLIGNSKNRKRLGLYLGTLLGPIGWIVMLFVDEVAPGETGNGLAIALVCTAIPVALGFGSNALVAYLDIADKQQISHQPEKAANPPAGPTPPPTPDHEAMPQAIKDIAKENGWPIEEAKRSFYESLPKQKLFLIHGVIEQHLSTGHLLIYGAAMDPHVRVGSRTMIALFGDPQARQLADDTDIQCLAWVVGTLQYHATDGSTSTVYEYVFSSDSDAGGRVIGPQNAMVAPVAQTSPPVLIPAATPIPRVDPAAVRASIERKYGTR